MVEVLTNKNVPVPPLSAETALGEQLGLTSLDYAELVVRLEIEFGKDLPATGELPDFRTVGDLARFYGN
jgi:acyl carrier protein